MRYILASIILILLIFAAAELGYFSRVPNDTVWNLETGSGREEATAVFQGAAQIVTVDVASTTSPTRKHPDTHETLPFLARYPFKNMSPPIIVAEGFAYYDGFLGDPRGEIHRGIDYVRILDGEFLKFNVFAMHNGEAWRGHGSDTWGDFVIVRRTLTPTLRYYTVYAHLENVPTRFPERPVHVGEEVPGAPVTTGTFLGIAGNTGNTKNVPQLHIELHEENLEQGTWLKLDPYGAYSTRSSRDYPNPGESLEELDHFWADNRPKFAP